MEDPLSEGCDLWIVADSASSRWSRKIDWYLNFQIMKSERHVARAMSPELISIENEWMVEHVDAGADPGTPLLIASGSCLPVSKTVVVPFQGDLKKWIATCVETWQGFRRPNVRIFLPDSVQPDVAQKSWSSASGARTQTVQFIG